MSTKKHRCFVVPPLFHVGHVGGKSADHTLRDALFEEDGEKRMPKLFSKIQDSWIEDHQITAVHQISGGKLS